jgi:hypothetical protein
MRPPTSRRPPAPDVPPSENSSSPPSGQLRRRTGPTPARGQLPAPPQNHLEAVTRGKWPSRSRGKQVEVGPRPAGQPSEKAGN